MKATTLLTLTVGVAASTATVIGAAIISTFDSGADGWRTADIQTSNFAPTGSFGSVIPISGGDGFIVTEDTLGWIAFAAPAKFLGNQSDKYGGTLSFDLGSDWNDGAAYPLAVLYGGGNTLVLQGGPPATVLFSHYDLALVPGNWRFNNGALADAAQIQGVLTDLQGLFIDADWHTGTDWSRLNNVVLTAIPEPVACLGASGLAVLGFAAYRRIRS